MMKYKNFISFLNDNVQNDNELDLIIYNIGAVQRIVEQFSYFYNQKIKQGPIKDAVEFEIEFEAQCNEKIHLALNLGNSETLFVDCSYQDGKNTINIHKELIAELTLEGIRNE